MTEQIGKITLDYKYYPGEDLYCDGAIEDELLEIVKNHAPNEFLDIIEQKASWPVLYHLSPLRENIVDWIPMNKESKVLEVGSGCGAITGAFARKASEVTCIDLSRKRSLINAYRHKECSNVTIQVGNFKDIEPELPKDYDYIFLIGVFEYGQGYMGTDTPYEDFMAILKKHLSPKGRMVIAIENKFGLKYWAGCKEDHYGTYFSGLEDYPKGGVARTFTRKGLEKILEKNEITKYSFYYPYPDYKFMTSVYSDSYLPKVGELSNNTRNFDRNRLQLFDEKNVFDTILREGVFPEFSNSYLLLIGDPILNKFTKYSNDRLEKFAIRTEIHEDYKKNRRVFKVPLNNEALSHIKHIETSKNQLEEIYQNETLNINRCVLEGDRLELEYLTGKTLEMKLDECLDRHDEAGFRLLVKQFIQFLHAGDDSEITDYDMIFSNIMLSEETGEWTVIDYEWTFPVKVNFENKLFRALYCYLIGGSKRRKICFRILNEELGVEEAKVTEFVNQELEFQHFVTGNRMSMTELRDKIGKEIFDVAALTKNEVRIKNEKLAEERQREVQIYLNRGMGFNESDSYFLTKKESRAEVVNSDYDKSFSFGFTVENNVEQIRIDPGMEACILHIQSIQIDKEALDEADFKGLESNGYAFAPDMILFATSDPNFTINLSDIVKYRINKSKKEGGSKDRVEAMVGRLIHSIKLEMGLQLISTDMAEKLMNKVTTLEKKKWFLR